MAVDAHPELQSLRRQLREIYEAIATFGSTQLAVKPPILESSIDPNGGDVNEEFHSHQDAVHGLRALRDSIRRDLDILEKVSLISILLHASPRLLSAVRLPVVSRRPEVRFSTSAVHQCSVPYLGVERSPACSATHCHNHAHFRGGRPDRPRTPPWLSQTPRCQG